MRQRSPLKRQEWSRQPCGRTSMATVGPTYFSLSNGVQYDFFAMIGACSKMKPFPPALHNGPDGGTAFRAGILMVTEISITSQQTWVGTRLINPQSVGRNFFFTALFPKCEILESWRHSTRTTCYPSVAEGPVSFGQYPI